MARRRYRRRKTKGSGALVFVIFGLAIILTILGVTFQQILVGILIGVGFAIALAITIIILRTPKVKGKLGERKIAKLLEKIASKGDAYVINDVIVPSENGATSQIDHILFAPGGIFVIETKNYSGRIYGTESQRDWTQVLAYGRTKNKFYNPIKQNQTHVYRLKELVGKNLPFESCVVFIAADLNYLDCEDIFTPRDLKRYLKDYAYEELIPSDQLFDAYNKVIMFKENPIQTTKEHVKEIKQTQRNISNNICPRCGGELVLRKSKDGREFYGCSNYPKCKFTKKA